MLHVSIQTQIIRVLLTVHDVDFGQSDLILSYRDRVQVLRPPVKNNPVSFTRRVRGKYTTVVYQLNVFCDANFYGNDCGTYCEEGTTYTCDDFGHPVCRENYFGKNCTKFCKPSSNNTHGFYTCSPTGEKICREDYFGPNCTQTCAVESKCLPGWFGPDCSKYCTMSQEGKYVCSVDGNKICGRHWYGNDCERYCRSDHEHYYCDTKGYYVCMNDWYGSHCSTYCVQNRNDQDGFYDCGGNGEKICMENWHGPNCTVQCKEEKSHTCDADTGKKICKAGFLGVNCTVVDECTQGKGEWGAERARFEITNFLEINEIRLIVSQSTAMPEIFLMK